LGAYSPEYINVGQATHDLPPSIEGDTSMTKNKYRTMILCLALALVAGLTPKPTFADDRNSDEDRPVRLYAYGGVGPIGKLDSLNAVTINGRMVSGQQLLWGGEMLQAPPDSSVRVMLDSIGQVTLHCGAIARIGVTRKRFDDNIAGSVLIASLVKGDVAVKLRENAEAYVEASGSVITASRGASFLAGVGESGPVLNSTTGTVTVHEQAVRQGNYMIRPVGGRTSIDVRLRKSRQVQFIVTDENDKPVPDVPVLISIAGGGATLGSGAASITVTTSAAGIASTSVSAGTAVGAGTITAAVPGTTATTSVAVSAVSAGVIGGTTLAVAAAAVAAGTATTVIVVKAKDKAEIKEARPPSITPSSIR
jgi:hypothetical protein